MGKSILSKEINSMKYLLGYKRGVVISEQQGSKFGNPNQFSTNLFDPKTQAPNTQTTADISNEVQRQKGAAAQIYRDFQTNNVQQSPATPAPATPASNVNPVDLIKQIQTILKTKYGTNLGTSGPNKDGIDGIWGKNTQTALEAAIAKVNTPAAAPVTPPVTAPAPVPAPANTFSSTNPANQVPNSIK